MTINRNKYLCIGHCCHDKTEAGYILGGTTSYASIVAQKLGKQTTVLTSVGRDFLFHSYFDDLGIAFENIEASETTVFQNTYDIHGHRTQYLLARADIIGPNHIHHSMLDSGIVQLCLIDDEIDWSVVDRFEPALKGATIQGCLRQWNQDGLVSAKEMDWTLLSKVDVAIFSTQDIKGFEHCLPAILDSCGHVVITDGSKGATVHYKGEDHHFPAYAVKEVDATGAGDVFTTSYLIRYAETMDISAACMFAHCTASFVIEGEGLSKLPSREEVKERMKAYKEQIL